MEHVGCSQRIRTFKPSGYNNTFILSGAMAPVTPIGVLAADTCRSYEWHGFWVNDKWCTSCFGSFASSISMQSGAPTFGTPELAIVLFTTKIG